MTQPTEMELRVAKALFQQDKEAREPDKFAYWINAAAPQSAPCVSRHQAWLLPQTMTCDGLNSGVE